MSRLQPVDAGAQVRHDRHQVAQDGRQPARWLTCENAAIYLDFPSARAFYQWARRNSLPCSHRGRVLIFWSADLDAAIGATWKR